MLSASRVLAVSFGIVALAALAASPVRALEEDFRAMNEAIARHHIIPRYEVLAKATDGLADSAKAFCAAPRADGIEKLAKGYAGAESAWQGVQHLRFGPVALFRRYDRMAFWPDTRNTIGRQLGDLIGKRDTDNLKPENLIHGSVAVQGLPALERLLFDADARTELLAGDDEVRFRCRVIETIAANVQGMAADTLRDWRDGDTAFVVQFRSAHSSAYHTPKEATLELFKALYGALEIVADHKLAKPLGASVKDAKPRLAEAWRSGQSLANVRVNLDAATDLFAAQGGFGSYLRSHGNAALADQLDKNFAQVKQAAAAVAKPLEEAIADSQARPAVEVLTRSVAAFKVLLVERLAPALDIPVGFNSLDGD